VLSKTVELDVYMYHVNIATKRNAAMVIVAFLVSFLVSNNTVNIARDTKPRKISATA